MTLISYSSRIHFADGVLEEALRSEMEARRNARPLIVTLETNLEDETIALVLTGLPLKSSAHFFHDVREIATEYAAAAIARYYRTSDRDCLIAVGGARTIDLAKISRFEIAQDGALRTCSNFQSAKESSVQGLPNFYAVPDTLGLAAAVSPHVAVILSGGESSRLTTS